MSPMNSPPIRFDRAAPARLFGVAMLLLACAWGGARMAGAAAQQSRPFETAPLTIVSGDARHGFTVEIARSDGQRARGLMFRRSLAPDRGMLFIYPSPRLISMWMKNTYIPLDMIFIGAGGEVVSIHERAVPHSLTPIGSGKRAVAVLEVPGGTAGRLGIRPGDRVVNPLLGAAR